jgi:chromosome segregation ATPase
MKYIIIFLLFGSQVYGQMTIKQVNSLVTAAITPLNTKVTTLTNQAAALTATNTVQDKTIVTLQAQLKAYSVDSAATKKRLSDAEKALLAKDTQFTNLNKNYMALFDQHSTLYSRTDSLNKRMYDAAIKTLIISKSLDSLGALVDSVKVYTDPKIFVFNGNVMTVPLLNQLAAQIKLIIDRLKILGISL